MEELKINKSLIVTEDEEDEIHEHKKTIKVIPAYQWILSGY